MRADGAGPRALRWLVLVNLAFVAVALLCGPERVRVFAENGTLLNRLLMQLCPGAAVAVVAGLSATAPGPPRLADSGADAE